MPTYEYACKQCGEHLEVVQSFTDDPLSLCPSCGGELRKVFGNVGIVFKGSGFYKTDSRSGAKGSKTSEAASGKGDSSAGDTGSGGSKAEGDKSSKPDKSKSDTSDKAAGPGSSDKSESSGPKGSGKADSKPAAAAS
ncbi:MAG: FmdB family zinc ribbon protein [Acidimicrobiales bacterium]